MADFCPDCNDLLGTDPVTFERTCATCKWRGEL